MDDDPQSDALTEQPGDGALMASYSVFVVEPGEDIGNVLRHWGYIYSYKYKNAY